MFVGILLEQMLCVVSAQAHSPGGPALSKQESIAWRMSADGHPDL